MKKFIRYVSLNILGMLGLSCYILADTYFVAQWLGANGITALNLVIPVYNLISGLGLMLGMGGCAKYMIHRSCQQNQQANQIFTQVLYLWGIFSLLLVFAGIFYTEKIVTLLGADEQTFEMSRTYLKTLLICSPLFMLNHILLCFVRNDGMPERSMAAMIIGSLSNILLDYVFIFLFKMGMFGAVLATCFSPVISMIVLLPFFLKKQNHFRPVRTKLYFRQSRYLLSLGGASFVTELSNGIVILVFNLLMLKLAGNTGVAAYGIIANISLVVTCIWTGTAQGVQPLVSECYGQNKSPMQYYRYACITVIGLFILIYSGILLFASPIAEIFNKEQDMLLQSYAVQGLRYYFSGAVFAGLNILTTTLLSATEQPLQSNMLSLLRGFIFMIPSACLLANLAGIKGIWLTYPVAEFLTLLIAIYFMNKNKTEQQKACQ